MKLTGWHHSTPDGSLKIGTVMTFPVGLWSQSDSCLQLMRPPEASAQALKKVLTEPKAQAAGGPCACRTASPWEHGWSRAACAKVQMPFVLSQGIRRALSGRHVPLCNAESVFLEVHFSATWSRAQGPGAGISCCTLLFRPETPAWHRSALGQAAPNP